LPVAYLVCNFTPPIGTQPSLLTFREVETLFHEFGHGLQHMLTQIDEFGASGINGVEWDAVELPSQFMENWCYHPATLRALTSHVQTQASLPDEIIEKINALRKFFAGTQACRQSLFAWLDLYLHENPQEVDTVQAPFALHRRLAKELTARPPLETDRFLCSFSHIFAGGYAAGYYSYRWAEVLSADAFGLFEEEGLDNEQAVKRHGQRFRDTVLGLGGSVDPNEVFEQFRGRPPEIDALLRHKGLC
ncbi:MAG: M3 family metallopeptidase, partial [Myxococcota bacterium]